MENVMDKIFKIVYIGAYTVCGLFLIFHTFTSLSFVTLLIAYGVATIVLFFLGYLIQEHLDHILQLYLIIVGIVTIIFVFFKDGAFFSIKLPLLLLGVGFIGISFLFDEFFEPSE